MLPCDGPKSSSGSALTRLTNPAFPVSDRSDKSKMLSCDENIDGDAMRIETSEGHLFEGNNAFRKPQVAPTMATRRGSLQGSDGIDAAEVSIGLTSPGDEAYPDTPGLLPKPTSSGLNIHFFSLDSLVANHGVTEYWYLSDGEDEDDNSREGGRHSAIASDWVKLDVGEVHAEMDKANSGQSNDE